MKIGDKLTNTEFRELKKSYLTSTFTGTHYALGGELIFKAVGNDWELESTRESRIADQDTGHASIHRTERRKFKGYYENKS
jgi:hypothetical protein